MHSEIEELWAQPETACRQIVLPFAFTVGVRKGSLSSYAILLPLRRNVGVSVFLHPVVSFLWSPTPLLCFISLVSFTLCCRLGAVRVSWHFLALPFTLLLLGFKLRTSWFYLSRFSSWVLSSALPGFTFHASPPGF